MARNSISKLHQQAIDNLQITDVFIMTSTSEISTDFEPKYSSGSDKIGIQYKHIVDRSTIVSFSSEEEENAINLFRVYVDLGAKWNYVPDNQEEEGDNNENEEPLAKIEACYVAEYQLKKETPQEALEEFALNNASHHIWPYWREYLMSQAMRMNLPKVALPIVQFSVANNNKRKSSAKKI